MPASCHAPTSRRSRDLLARKVGSRFLALPFSPKAGAQERSRLLQRTRVETTRKIMVHTGFGRKPVIGASLKEGLACPNHSSGWHSVKIRPNQALERTADRRVNLLSMTSTLKPKAQL